MVRKDSQFLCVEIHPTINLMDDAATIFWLEAKPDTRRQLSYEDVCEFVMDIIEIGGDYTAKSWHVLHLEDWDFDWLREFVSLCEAEDARCVGERWGVQDEKLPADVKSRRKRMLNEKAHSNPIWLQRVRDHDVLREILWLECD